MKSLLEVVIMHVVKNSNQPAFKFSLKSLAVLCRHPTYCDRFTGSDYEVTVTGWVRTAVTMKLPWHVGFLRLSLWSFCDMVSSYGCHYEIILTSWVRSAVTMKFLRHVGFLLLSLWSFCDMLGSNGSDYDLERDAMLLLFIKSLILLSFLHILFSLPLTFSFFPPYFLPSVGILQGNRK
jgi:hypothetical protein